MKVKGGLNNNSFWYFCEATIVPTVCKSNQDCKFLTQDIFHDFLLPKQFNWRAKLGKYLIYTSCFQRVYKEWVRVLSWYSSSYDSGEGPCLCSSGWIMGYVTLPTKAGADVSFPSLLPYCWSLSSHLYYCSSFLLWKNGPLLHETRTLCKLTLLNCLHFLKR